MSSKIYIISASSKTLLTKLWGLSSHVSTQTQQMLVFSLELMKRGEESSKLPNLLNPTKESLCRESNISWLWSTFQISGY